MDEAEDGLSSLPSWDTSGKWGKLSFYSVQRVNVRTEAEPDVSPLPPPILPSTLSLILCSH
jgi:hypothetical protein